LTRRKRAVEAAAPAVVEFIEPDPLLIVVRLDQEVPHARMVQIRESVLAALGENPPAVVVVQPGITIEAVLDPRKK
jgi:hypothetical protein